MRVCVCVCVCVGVGVGVGVCGCGCVWVGRTGVLGIVSHLLRPHRGAPAV